MQHLEVNGAERHIYIYVYIYIYIYVIRRLKFKYCTMATFQILMFIRLYTPQSGGICALT